MQNQPLTPQYLEAAAKALTWVQDQSHVRWADEDGEVREATLRGWNSREDDVRERTVRTTSPTGFEDEVPFADLVDFAARYQMAVVR